MYFFKMFVCDENNQIEIEIFIECLSSEFNWRRQKGLFRVQVKIIIDQDVGKFSLILFSRWRGEETSKNP